MGDDLISVIFVALGTEAISVSSMRLAKKNRKELDMTIKSQTKRAASAATKKETTPGHRIVQKEFTPGRGYTKEDWDEVSDNPEWTEEDIGNAKPFKEVFPELYASIERARGRPPIDYPKQSLTLRLDQDVIAKFKATGKGWQSRINDVLKQAKVK